MDSAREAGDSIKPGARAPGSGVIKIFVGARETGDSVIGFRAVARYRGLARLFY